MEDKIVLDVKNLKQHFQIGSGRGRTTLKAVDGINFQVKKGEVFSLVGESGCGKTTTGRSLIGLYEITDGEITFLDTLISTGDQSLKQERKAVRVNTNKEIKELKATINESNKLEVEAQIQTLLDESKVKIAAINEHIKTNQINNI